MTEQTQIASILEQIANYPLLQLPSTKGAECRYTGVIKTTYHKQKYQLEVTAIVPVSDALPEHDDITIQRLQMLGATFIVGVYLKQGEFIYPTNQKEYTV